ncbi:excinuclease ABC subunit UvrB [Candidatus Xianfuyuplasma coldseepsis]|uniref:UvrABC system protein B n=1 Tax=Candidatus Xianfuyuplasma coldseepsis TaxID=2782163 RepID=A0A7L7KS25_9MOLU|nr:excinuclease ABC subunit UvrB [Xianfuyuplasma coldseepsis]QMS84754.1 excinuclease ABC subunit UvrB [Xianfuyuplasma coldseepsis]
MPKFELVADFKPMGDQIKAIDYLSKNIEEGISEQVLLGATGTGKTFTISNVIERVQKKTLVLAHNKTLAGQLYSELKQLFPNNRVEYFISYYDYYQPEAYVPSRDLYIEKDAQTNDEIDEMRHSATASLLERDDVIVVASVSCIYGIGDPDDYKNSMLTLRVGDDFGRDNLLVRLVDMLFTRNDYDFSRGSFRVKGDVVEILPMYSNEIGIRVELFDDEIERIREFNILTGEVVNEYSLISLFPATQFVTNKEKIEEGIRRIEEELAERVQYYKENDKYLEAERIQQRTNYDIEMLKEIGSCSGVENYSRHLSLRNEGETPSTLMDFFGDDYLLIVDESHVTLPQVRGMYNGDRSRKMTLVEYGFRLPSALDNRPLNFDEFYGKTSQIIYLSATPGDYEMQRTPYLVEQIIRPTGLLDPVVEVRSKEGQIDDIVAELLKRVDNNQRTLITTLTIKMSEDLTNYLKELGLKVAYLHSEIKSLERIEIIRELRLGTYDVLVGINLLREGLDIPEVALICILDADKQGFLRSNRSLVQTIGRAARNKDGKVIMYADKITDAMQYAISETARRREIQETYNQKHGIEPKTIVKSIRESISVKLEISEEARPIHDLSKEEKKDAIAQMEKEMRSAAQKLDFERAAELRDIIIELKSSL